MKHRRKKKNLILSLSILFVIGFSIFIMSWSLVNAIPSKKPLKTLAAPNTKIGSIANYNTLFPGNGDHQKKYRKLYKQELNSGTVASYSKEIWQSPQQYDLSDFNAVVNWFERQNFTQIAHLPIRPNHYLPDWLLENSYSDGELEKIMEDGIKAIMQSNNNQTKVDIWVVINEALWLKGGAPYAGTVWNQLGSEADRSGLTGIDKKLDSHQAYIGKALKIARKYTKNKLAILDNGIEFPDDDEYQIFYQLVRHLVNQKVPLDAVGFQTHLSVDKTYDWQGLKNNIKRYKDLGLEVYIAELDVGNDGTKEGRKKQKSYYYHAVKAAREGGADIINLWGLRDGQMGEYKEDEYPLTFEGIDMTPKPAYYGIQKALKRTK